MYVTDWFPTLSKLAGVDPADDWRDASGIVRGIDGVDLWPTLRDGDAVATSWIEREFLPTSERSLIYWPLADRNTVRFLPSFSLSLSLCSLPLSRSLALSWLTPLPLHSPTHPHSSPHTLSLSPTGKA